MIKSSLTSLAFIICLCFLSFWSQAQLRLPQPSPTVKIIQNFGVSEITLDYSRPSLKGRSFGEGDLNYYGRFWRTGANQATTITLGADVTINGQKLPAGKYGLYSVPDKNEWSIVFSKNAGVTDEAAYKQEEDALRVIVKPVTNEITETFTIDLASFTPSSAVLNIKWDKILIPLKIESDVKGQTLSSIEKEVGKMWSTLAQAANYALDNEGADKGKKWIDQSIAFQEQYFNTYVKSRYLAKEGDYGNAVKYAEKSLNLAKEAKNDFYVTQNEKNITEWTPKIVAPKGKTKKTE